MASLALLLILLLISLAAPLVARTDPEFVAPGVRLLGPSGDHWLGTDQVGRDVFSRLVYGGRISLLVGFTVTILAALIGTTLGLVAGYYSRADGPIMRVLDGFMAFPGVLLAIAIVVSLGARTSSVIIALTIVYIPVVARPAWRISATSVWT